MPDTNIAAGRNMEKVAGVVGVLLIMTTLFVVWRQSRQREAELTELRQIRRTLDPYYDITKRRYIDPDDVDIGASSFGAVAAPIAFQKAQEGVDAD